MQAYPRVLDPYRPLNDALAGRDRLSQTSMAHAYKGRSFERLPAKSYGHIMVEDTVCVV